MTCVPARVGHGGSGVQNKPVITGLFNSGVSVKRKPNISAPSYRYHKPSGQGVVTLSGKDYYLGPWQSESSLTEYRRLLAEWMAAARTAPAAQANMNASLTIGELLAAYLVEAEVIYKKNGEPSTHLHNVKDGMIPLRELYATEPVTTFGPLKLKAVRETFIARGQCRSTVNKHIGTIKRIFKWGTENELVPATVFHALQAVGGLRRGRSTAKESVPVKPVPDAYVEAACEHLSTQVIAMVRLQQLTGMRPGEVTIMRGCDLDTTGKVWTYNPSTHKTEHHGIERPIYLGPKAQDVIKPFLKADLSAHLFDPREMMNEFQAMRRKNRKTPMTPSQRRRTKKRNPKSTPMDHYTTESYRRAIARACQKADKRIRAQHPDAKAEDVYVPSWHPHQLRHNAATRLRKEFGIEAARVVLGHRTAAVTEVYAEMDQAKASSIMGRVG
jgi:integrase